MRYIISDKTILVYSEFCPVPKMTLEALHRRLSDLKIFVRHLFGLAKPVNEFVTEFPMFEKISIENKCHLKMRRLPYPVLFMNSVDYHNSQSILSRDLSLTNLPIHAALGALHYSLPRKKDRSKSAQVFL